MMRSHHLMSRVGFQPAAGVWTFFRKNPKGISPQSPGLPSLRGYPGSEAATFSTLKVLRLLAASDVASALHARTKTQPRWGCHRNERLPRVVARSNPGLGDEIPLGFTGKKCP